MNMNMPNFHGYYPWGALNVMAIAYNPKYDAE
jgi:hypothetical protein